MRWVWDWQHGLTLVLVGGAVVYLSRHVLRSMISSPGAGCGVSVGCGGCSIKGKSCNIARGLRSDGIPCPDTATRSPAP